MRRWLMGETVRADQIVASVRVLGSSLEMVG